MFTILNDKNVSTLPDWRFHVSQVKNVYRYIVIHISLCLCYLETVYTTLIVPVATCKNEKVINKYKYRWAGIRQTWAGS
jgi:hypothetical protein